MNLEHGYVPANTDVYNPFLPNFGNSNYGVADKYRTIAWGTVNDSKLDLRLFYVFKHRDDWTKCRWDPNDESIPKFWRISPISGKQICYTPEVPSIAQLPISWLLLSHNGVTTLSARQE